MRGGAPSSSVPVQRRADQIAIPILGAYNEHANLGERLLTHPAPRIGNQPIGGKLF